jgi:S-adenosylmethionine-diacylglycerol 3-amino-3-carboxypropyl transferase
MRQAARIRDRLDQRLFDALYSRSLVYNACWEDPAVDRQALGLQASHEVLAITSAGCNVLDYALTGARCIHAVDANPRQSALLELKLAGIRRLDHAEFFAFFGEGFHRRAAELYRSALRGELSEFARRFWDRHIDWFASGSGSFYFHGLSGLVARAFRAYLRTRPRLGGLVEDLFDASSLDEQRHIYDRYVRPRLWSPGMGWALSRSLTMSLLGVPYPQRREVQEQHPGGIAGFVREAVDYVFRELPARTNYFWSVYVRGRYTPECCPEYLREDNFLALRNGLVDAVIPHTRTVTDFLRSTDARISRFVLLDHMDWMASDHPQALLEEWNAILHRATPGARVIFRSAHARPRYLDWIAVGDDPRPLREVVRFDEGLAARLQREDRVHTYAGFHIADLPAAC